MIVVVYLISIVLANSLITLFGPSFSIVNALVFIGLDITLRDRLHDTWHNKNLFLKMLFLIISGGIISFIVNSNTLMIAVASTIAFILSAIADSIVYQILYNKSFLIKSNSSNIVSSIVDSFVFPTIAFGGFLPLITLGQIVAKILGGFLWSLVLKKINNKK